MLKDEKRRRETATRYRHRPGFTFYIATLPRYVAVVVFSVEGGAEGWSSSSCGLWHEK